MNSNKTNVLRIVTRYFTQKQFDIAIAYRTSDNAIKLTCFHCICGTMKLSADRVDEMT